MLSRSVMSDSLWHPWTVACQALLSMGLSRQEHWSGLSCPPPGDLANPGIKLGSPALQADSLPTELSGKPLEFPMLYSIFSLVIYFIPVVYVCQAQSPNSSYTPTLCVHTFVLCVHVSISALQIRSSIYFYRFRKYMLLYGICFSLSYLLISAWQPLGSSTSPFSMDSAHMILWSFGEIKPSLYRKPLLHRASAQRTVHWSCWCIYSQWDSGLLRMFVKPPTMLIVHVRAVFCC